MTITEYIIPSPTTLKAYVHLSADKTILTFYFDTLRAERDGTTWGIGDTKKFRSILIPAWAGTFESPNTPILTAVFDASFRGFRPTTTAGWFQFFQSLKSIEGLEHINTSQVMDMSYMFSGCSSLTTLDLSRFDTSKVTDMSRMFSSCSSLTTLDLSSFDTSKVTNMSYMFDDCSSLTALDLSSFDTSKVTNASCMFDDCSSLTALDLSNFDTSQVTGMGAMFSGCSSLTSLDLSNFDTSEVRDMESMFSGCKSLTTIYCNSSWSCRKTDYMFSDCDFLKGAVTYDECERTGYMANPETGYFTKKAVLRPKNEAYVHLSADETILTFYYDTLRAERDGTTWGIREKKEFYNTFTPAWTGDSDSLNTSVLTAVFDTSFRDFCPTTTAEWFQYFKSLKSIEGLEHLNTSKVKSMRGMFSHCQSLTSLDLSGFDTSKVTSMWKMFYGCSALTTLDLSSFDTSQVTDMSRMFEDCSSLTSLDLSSFDTSQVTYMSYMFSGCKSLITIYCKSSWNCDSSANMFTGCVSLSGAATYEKGRDDVSMANPQTGYFTKNVLTKENGAYVLLTADKKTLTFYFDRKRNFHKGDCWLIEGTTGKDDNKISLWADCAKKTKEEITKVVIDESFRNFVPKTTAGWFEGLTALEEIRGLDNLNTSEVTDMSRMFAGCDALRSLDVSRFDTLNVKQMQQMFMGCAALTELDLYFFDTAKVTDMSEMFKDCKGLTALDLQSFNTAQVTDMGEMFRDCESLTTLALSSFYTSRVTNMGYMFAGCKSLSTLNLAHFFTDQVTTMWRMFEGCSALESLVLSCFNTAQVTDMSRMFAGCKRLTALDLLNFNTAQVTNMVQMFADCSALADLDISRFNTSQVTDMHEMFLGCAALSALNLAHFDTAQVTDLHAMFKDCKSLTTLDLSNFQTSEVKDMREMFSGCVALTTIWSFAFRNCFASEAMFYECTSLQGATNFNEKYTDARMANPERGYFSRK